MFRKPSMSYEKPGTSKIPARQAMNDEANETSCGETLNAIGTCCVLSGICCYAILRHGKEIEEFLEALVTCCKNCKKICDAIEELDKIDRDVKKKFR